MDTSDWRAQLQPGFRKRKFKKLMDHLKVHHCLSDEDDLHELQKVAQNFERKTFAGATSQSDYSQKISLKMVSVQRQLQEEVYEKIKIMKETYLPELNEMYQKIATKLQQHDSLPQQPKSDQLEKLKLFKTMLELLIAFLQVSKSNILPNFKHKLGSYEKQIINFINAYRPRKAMPSLQPGQLPPPSMPSMPQPQSQLTQVQSHENQINSQLRPTNIQGPVATMLQDSMSSLQHNSVSGVSLAQQNMMNSMQPGANLDSGQGNAMNSMQQVPVSSLQQNTGNAPQQTNINPLSSQANLSSMDNHNWRPIQGIEPAMDTSDWRAQLHPDSRQRIVEKIMDTLKRHLPFSGQEGLHELRKIAQRFEEKIYTAAASQADYLRKISLKMHTMENQAQNTMANSMPSNPGGSSDGPSDRGSGMQSHVANQEQSRERQRDGGPNQKRKFSTRRKR